MKDLITEKILDIYVFIVKLCLRLKFIAQNKMYFFIILSSFYIVSVFFLNLFMGYKVLFLCTSLTIIFSILLTYCIVMAYDNYVLGNSLLYKKRIISHKKYSKKDVEFFFCKVINSKYYYSVLNERVDSSRKLSIMLKSGITSPFKYNEYFLRVYNILYSCPLYDLPLKIADEDVKDFAIHRMSKGF